MICKNFGKGEGGSSSGAGGSKRGSVGDTGIGIGSGIGPSPHVGVERGRHQGGGVPGSQWFQWSGAGRRIELIGRELKQDNVAPK